MLLYAREVYINRNQNGQKGLKFMQKKTKILSWVIAVAMLVTSFAFVTKYYTVGYDVYYGDVNVGVISSKAEAMDVYNDAATDVAECNRGRLKCDLSFVMTIASVSDIASSDLYRGIVEAAAGKEACYSINAGGASVAKLKTQADAEAAIEAYIALFNREDASIYSNYTIARDKDIVTEIVTVEEAVNLIRRSGLFTVVYKDIVEEEFEIPYQTTVIEDETIPEGMEICQQSGEAGVGLKREITFYENGVEKHNIDPVIKVVKEPVEEIKVVGTGKMVGLAKKSLPWPTTGTFTSDFGYRWGRNHNGVDIAASTGTKITAPAMGVVTFSGTKSGYGNYVMIDHGNGYVTTYAHMNSRCVNEGDVVKVGDLIGTVGTTGRVTGAHLHFEILLNGKYVDPMAYIAG